MRLFPSKLLIPVALSMVAGCTVGPRYRQPEVAIPAAYKEAQAGWVPAAPADMIERGRWWTVFNDPVLDRLVSAVEVSNQNVAAAAAAYAQARALVRQQRAALFPVVSLDGSATRSGGGTSTSRTSTAAGGRSGNNVELSIGASWELDVWGRLREGMSSAQASAQASAADLASATLSAQGELAADYFSLRQTDVQLALLRDTIAGYQRTLQITSNRYAAGIAAKTDVLQAQTQLANAQADEAGLVRQRAQFEHAIAVLAGKAPGEFSLPATAEWNVVVPDIPAGVPSTLLQRRPDIAAAERRVAAANAQIGVEQSAFYPNFGLNASYGSSASRVADLFGASNTLWSLGLSVAQTVFDAGAISARVDSARAAHEEAVARYRQTVLAAFQSVEDQLSAAQVLARQQEFRRQASQAADNVEAQMLNRYRAGQAAYTELVIAQVAALNARRALVQAQADRQTAAVALIQALGGGWQAPGQ
ncbi:MAG TPA: efflux transporter outer membrane subunit [Noviherbaspirillum sp.]